MRKTLFGILPLMAMAVGSAANSSNTANTAPKRRVPRPIWPSYGKSPANKRAAAHRKIWDDTPSADTMTRQRRRRAAMGRV